MTTTRQAHARRTRPDRGPVDRRRITAAALSALVPGLGQAANRRWRVAAIFLVPSLLLALVAWAVIAGQSQTRLIATLVVPATLGALMLLNVLLLAWRGLSVVHAWADRRHPLPPGRAAVVGLAVVFALTAFPHAIAWQLGSAASDTFRTVFEDPDDPDGDPGEPVATPAPDERLNVLLVGVDRGGRRTQALTDTLILASLDPVGRTLSLISIPRDLTGVPLGNGDTYAPKINSLLAYANRTPAQFPDGGMRALQDAIGALFGVPVHYHALVDLAGFVTVIDAVGGVTVNVRTPLSDPAYGGYGVGPGWSITTGVHHLDGANALAYARIRRSPGESDFTRARRQQQVLVALRDQAVGQNLLFSLPSLLRALGDTIRTDVPPAQLPSLAALAEEIDGSRTVRVVLNSPLIRRGPENSPYGYTLVADAERIREMAEAVMPPPGEEPRWPLPSPSATPAP